MNLATDPIPSLVRRIAFPASVGWFFNTMFNVVDTFWAGQFSAEAIAALSLSMIPFLGLLSVGIGLGQGSNALISNALGAQQPERAARLIVQALLLAVIASGLVLILGLSFTTTLYRNMGADGDYLQLALSYIHWLIYGCVTFILNLTANAGLNAQGDTKTYRNALIAGFLANIILDPLFLFGGGPLPALGVEGIALATILIQAGIVVFLLTQLRQSSLGQQMEMRFLLPQPELLRDLIRQSLPSTISMMFISVNFFVILHYVSGYGEDAVAAYGISTRIVQVMLLPTIGLNIAALSLTGFHFGAGNLEKVQEVWTTTMKVALWMMLAGALTLLVLPRLWLGLFTESTEIVDIGAQLLRVEAILLPAYATLFLGVAVLQGLKKPMFGMLLGIYRLILAPLLLFWLFSELFGYGLVGIWAGIFVTTLSGALITLGFVRFTLKRLNLGNQSESLLEKNSSP